jgi:hypothetical protein
MHIGRMLNRNPYSHQVLRGEDSERQDLDDPEQDGVPCFVLRNGFQHDRK